MLTQRFTIVQRLKTKSQVLNSLFFFLIFQQYTSLLSHLSLVKCLLQYRVWSEGTLANSFVLSSLIALTLHNIAISTIKTSQTFTLLSLRAIIESYNTAIIAINVTLYWMCLVFPVVPLLAWRSSQRAEEMQQFGGMAHAHPKCRDFSRWWPRPPPTPLRGMSRGSRAAAGLWEFDLYINTRCEDSYLLN